MEYDLFQRLPEDVILSILTEWHEMTIPFNLVRPNYMKLIPTTSEFFRADYYGYFNWDKGRTVHCVFRSICFVGPYRNPTFRTARMTFPLRLISVRFMLDNHDTHPRPMGKMPLALVECMRIMGSRSPLRKVEWTAHCDIPYIPWFDVRGIVSAAWRFKVELRELVFPLRSIRARLHHRARWCYKPPRVFLGVLLNMPSKCKVILRRSLKQVNKRYNMLPTVFDDLEIMHSIMRFLPPDYMGNRVEYNRFRLRTNYNQRRWWVES